MITFFTTFRNLNQPERNAIRSWLSLHEESEVIVFTESAEVSAKAELPRTIFVHEMTKHSSGPPLLNKLFEDASRLSKHKILCYCNSDIILLPEFLQRIEALTSIRLPFLAASQRIDVKIDFEVDFADRESVKMLRARVDGQGSVHPPMGSDVFVFPKGLYDVKSMPALVVGRPAWDNWMIYDARQRFNRLVDLTGDIPAVVHQDHPGNYDPANLSHQVNFEFLPPKDVHTFVLEYANYHWKKGRIVKRTPSDTGLKRVRWERKFAKGFASTVYWKTLLKYRTLLKKIDP
jgi:hypothetical protein